VNQIGNKQEFIEWLTYSDSEFEEKRYITTQYRPKGEMVNLDGLELLNLTIRDKHFECTEFKNCKFENCDFTNTFFASSTLENCHFQDCTFTWSKFLDVDLFTCQFEACTILGLELSDAVLKKTLFINCGEILDLSIRESRERNVSFINCYLQHLDIEPISEEDSEKIEFVDCLINESSFDRVDFTEGGFEDCKLSLNQFSACTFSSNSFSRKNETPGNEYNLIDIRSLLNSETIDSSTLEILFGIHSPDVKEYLIGLTSKIEFQSIFISYSFKDKDFAKRINEELMRRGILTFLWEKDSPGGKPLKTIMTEGVKSKDRVLLIASAHSLKSEACQFELTEGRKKQENIWEDVLFPIHIDDYLFELKKESIRPKEKQEEYWKNITELKDLNSLSFSDFVKPSSTNKVDFEKQLMRLIKGLRK
jgi:uncharacterized protein YjbI with pentapeptide repeats